MRSRKAPLRDPKKAAVAKLALKLGYKQHSIAAYFNDNQGRVSQLNTGQILPNITPAVQLPADFPPLG